MKTGLSKIWRILIDYQKEADRRIAGCCLNKDMIDRLYTDVVSILLRKEAYIKFGDGYRVFMDTAYEDGEYKLDFIMKNLYDVDMSKRGNNDWADAYNFLMGDETFWATILEIYKDKRYYLNNIVKEFECVSWAWVCDVVNFGFEKILNSEVKDNIDDYFLEIIWDMILTNNSEEYSIEEIIKEIFKGLYTMEEEDFWKEKIEEGVSGSFGKKFRQNLYNSIWVECRDWLKVEKTVDGILNRIREGNYDSISELIAEGSCPWRK